jgi:hypothetical protein
LTKWSLPQLLEGLHKRIHEDLATARKTMGHPGTKGDASEEVWLQLLSKYLPRRYRVAKSFVVDSKGIIGLSLHLLPRRRGSVPD